MPELNAFLQPENSPVTGTVAKDAYTFNYENDRNIINNYNLRNFTFSKGTGGTLTLGGTVNGNGLLILKNGAGSVIVQGDSTGLTINDGSIVINNSSGSLALDASGIVSASNFKGVSVSANGSWTNTTSNMSDVPNSSLTNLVITRPTRVLCFFFAYGWNENWIPNPTVQDGVEIHYIDNNSGSVIINNYLTGNAMTSIDAYFTSANYILHAQSVYRQQINTLSAGTYSFKLQFATEGSGTAALFAYEDGYIVLGT